MTEAYYIGVDPDLHTMGIVIMQAPNKVVKCLRTAVPIRLKQEDAIASTARETALLSGLLPKNPAFVLAEKHVIVESQEHYPGSRVPPQDLILLGQAAGIAAGMLSIALANIKSISLVRPKEWKGNIDKPVHQEMIRKFLDIEETNSHVLDACGLALWGMVRDSIPRDPDRGDSRIRGSVLSLQRLNRLSSHFARSPRPPL